MNERIMPEDFGRGAWVDQTTLHPLGLALVLVCGVVMLYVPRRHAIWPMLLVACFVAPAQRLVILSLDFNLLRLLVLFGWLRIALQGEHAHFTYKPLDGLVLAGAAARTLIFTLQQGTIGAFVYQLGSSFDAVGMYFLFRCVVRNWDDVTSLAHGLVLLVVPVAAVLLVERFTTRNLFAFFGGVPEVTLVRDGRLRCQGAFAHPILAGVFWVGLLPMMLALWWQPLRGRTPACVAGLSVLLIVYCCASSTPVAAVLFGLIAAMVFWVRTQMRLMRWGLLAGLVGLHLFMKAPVWHLISRVDLAGGSTGHHRFLLVDRAIANFGEWWLWGTRSTAHWAWGLQDVTNQYVLEGVRGGLLTLGLFVAALAVAYASVGRIWRAAANSPADLAMSWALGVALFIHTTSFFGVSYFGQIIITWYLLLAMIGSLTPTTTARCIGAHTRRPVSARPVRRPGNRPVLGPRGARPAHDQPVGRTGVPRSPAVRPLSAARGQSR